MSVWLGLVLLIATVLAMELAAYVGHRWVMHGPLWSLHKSHHTPREGRFERNDWFAVMGAVPSILLIFMGTQLHLGDAFTWVGAGVIVYGAIYAGFHDIIVHRRLATGYVPRSAYMKRIVQAHRLHHAVDTKHGTVSFGFLYAPPVKRLLAELDANKTIRASSTTRRAASARASAADG